MKINRRQVAKTLKSFFSIASFFLIPALGIIIVAFFFVKINDLLGYHSENLENPVNKKSCSCDCWDGFFRSKYPRTSHDTEYKVFYFNYERKFLAIIYLILICIKIADRILAKLFRLVYRDIMQLWTKSSSNHRTKVQSNAACHLRAFSAINILFSLASNIYGVWVCVNYINESDERMISSQLFFMLTELIPTYVYYQTLNRYSMNEKDVKNHVTIEHLASISSISALHLYLAINEEILWGLASSSHRGNLIRDMVLVFSDISGLVFAIFYLLKARMANPKLRAVDSRKRTDNSDERQMVLKSLILFSLIAVGFLYYYYKYFCEFHLRKTLKPR